MSQCWSQALKEPTVRAQHHAPTCRLLEKDYGLPPGSVFYIDLPYEEEKAMATTPAREQKLTKDRGKRRRRI